MAEDFELPLLGDHEENDDDDVMSLEFGDDKMEDDVLFDSRNHVVRMPHKHKYNLSMKSMVCVLITFIALLGFFIGLIVWPTVRHFTIEVKPNDTYNFSPDSSFPNTVIPVTTLIKSSPKPASSTVKNVPTTKTTTPSVIISKLTSTVGLKETSLPERTTKHMKTTLLPATTTQTTAKSTTNAMPAQTTEHFTTKDTITTVEVFTTAKFTTMGVTTSQREEELTTQTKQNVGQVDITTTEAKTTARIDEKLLTTVVESAEQTTQRTTEQNKRTTAVDVWLTETTPQERDTKTTAEIREIVENTTVWPEHWPDFDGNEETTQKNKEETIVDVWWMETTPQQGFRDMTTQREELLPETTVKPEDWPDFDGTEEITGKNKEETTFDVWWMETTPQQGFKEETTQREELVPETTVKPEDWPDYDGTEQTMPKNEEITEFDDLWQETHPPQRNIETTTERRELLPDSTVRPENWPDYDGTEQTMPKDKETTGFDEWWRETNTPQRNIETTAERREILPDITTKPEDWPDYERMEQTTQKNKGKDLLEDWLQETTPEKRDKTKGEEILLYTTMKPYKQDIDTTKKADVERVNKTKADVFQRLDTTNKVETQTTEKRIPLVYDKPDVDTKFKGDSVEAELGEATDKSNLVVHEVKTTDNRQFVPVETTQKTLPQDPDSYQYYKDYYDAPDDNQDYNNYYNGNSG